VDLIEFVNVGVGTNTFKLLPKFKTNNESSFEFKTKSKIVKMKFEGKQISPQQFFQL